jgi:hypothetical protein
MLCARSQAPMLAWLTLVPLPSASLRMLQNATSALWPNSRSSICLASHRSCDSSSFACTALLVSSAAAVADFQRMTHSKSGFVHVSSTDRCAGTALPHMRSLAPAQHPAPHYTSVSPRHAYSRNNTLSAESLITANDTSVSIHQAVDRRTVAFKHPVGLRTGSLFSNYTAPQAL